MFQLIVFFLGRCFSAVAACNLPRGPLSSALLFSRWRRASRRTGFQSGEGISFPAAASSNLPRSTPCTKTKQSCFQGRCDMQSAHLLVFVRAKKTAVATSILPHMFGGGDEHPAAFVFNPEKQFFPAVASNKKQADVSSIGSSNACRLCANSGVNVAYHDTSVFDRARTRHGSSVATSILPRMFSIRRQEVYAQV